MIQHISKTGSPTGVSLLDEAWGVVWDKSDFQYINNIFRNIRLEQRNIKWCNRLRMKDKLFTAIERKNRLISQYDDIVLRNYQDQTVYDDLTKKRIDTQQISVAIDRCTQDGMGQIALLVCDETKYHFDYAASGAGTTPAQITDLILEFETARVDINTSGYHSGGGGGNTIKHAGIFAQGFMSAEITEFAVFTEPEKNSGVMLFRSVFPQSQALHHVAGSDFYSIAHTIYLSSV